MRPTRALDLLVIAVLGLAAVYGLLVLAYYSLPTALPRTAPLSLLLVGVAEVQLALTTRRRVLGRPRSRPILPLAVARLAALGKASSATAALTLGAWGAVLGYTLPRASAPPVAGADAITAGLGLLAGVVLLVGGLLLERACRVHGQ